MHDNANHILNVTRFARSSAVRQEEAENDDTLEAFKEARSKSREALMLDVRLTDGTIVSFPYAALSRVTYQPTGVIVLRFGGDTVTAEGRNLHRLRDALAEHRARFIQQGTDAEEEAKPEDAAHIERIQILEGDDEL
jgi:hypothetical protein